MHVGRLTDGSLAPRRGGSDVRSASMWFVAAVSDFSKTLAPRCPPWGWRLRWMSAVLGVAGLLVVAGPGSAQMATVPAAGFTTDWRVDAVAAGPGNVLYFGGRFSSVSRRTGHWVRFDASGARDVTWPEVDGPVRAVVSDGAGGWYLGGAFAHVAGQPRAGLAHVGPGGELDPIWSPDVHMNDWDPGRVEVTALAVAGDTVFVAGGFAEIDGPSARRSLPLTP